MKRPAATLLLIAVSFGAAVAGGPRAVNGVGDPMAWPTTGDISYHPDQGMLGTLDNGTARGLLATAFATWGVEAGLTFDGNDFLPGDIDAADLPADNADHWLHYWRIDDTWSPVIFDADGSIIDDLFGAGARFDVLGVAGLDNPIAAPAVITGASIVINGAFYDGDGLPDSPEDLSSQAAVQGVMVHEIGHFLNLDHSLLNHDLAMDNDKDNDVYVPSMYPVAVLDDTVFTDLAEDDKVALNMIYGTLAFTSISGKVETALGVPFQGAHVVIRNTTDPLGKAYAAFSGATYFPCNPGAACSPCSACPVDPDEQGAYQLSFIAAGQYSVCVEQPDRRFNLSNDNFAGPLAVPAVLAGPEECYSSPESPTDDPDAMELVPANFGAGKNITLNGVATNDPWEPNDPIDLAHLLDAQDTEPGKITSGDLDYFKVNVSMGQRLRVDIDGAELGSNLDPVIGLIDNNGTLIEIVDDAIDPDSHSFSVDPALDTLVGFDGEARIVVSAFPDLDLDGTGGGSEGGYWIRVTVETIVSCPAGTDGDVDMVCDPFDNCPVDWNPGQQDSDGDLIGDACEQMPDPDPDRPNVLEVFPRDGADDVALASDIVATFDEKIDPATADRISVYLSGGADKEPGAIRVSADGETLAFDPAASLSPDTEYTFTLTAGVRDLNGNPLNPRSSSFRTINDAFSGTTSAGQYGDTAPGTHVCGETTGDAFGSSVTVLGDVNQDAVADLLVGAPSVDPTVGIDSGRATLVFGGQGLQQGGTDPDLHYETGTAGDLVGATVSRAGDINGDGAQDFAIGAPGSDVNGAGSGAVYIVFGHPLLDGGAQTGPINLDALGDCASVTACGIQIRGELAGDAAGTSVAFAGNIDGDLYDDLLIGAPGADPDLNRGEAGKVYLLYGPLTGPVVELADVGTPARRGVVFLGEESGDRAGEALSIWSAAPGVTGDDLLIGAPQGNPRDPADMPVLDGGYVYATIGGPTLQGRAVGGAIELSRVGNGGMDEVPGMVFLGSDTEGEIGRSVTGSVDLDGDMVDDVIFGGNGQAWMIPGNDPKSVSGSSRTGGSGSSPAAVMTRSLWGLDAIDDFDARRYLPPDDTPPLEVIVGPGGDMNADGYEDLILGVPDLVIGEDVSIGAVYIVYGGPNPFGPDVLLTDVGTTVPGMKIEGVEAGDRLGAAVGGGLDVNDDGVADAVAGAPAGGNPCPTQDPGEAYVISPLAPSNVDSVMLEDGNGVMLEWSAASRAFEYNVYRGNLVVLDATGFVRTSDMTAIHCGILQDADDDGLPDAAASGSPPNGGLLAYLVTARNHLGESSLGPTAGAPPRRNDAACP